MLIHNVCKPKAKFWFRETGWKSDTKSDPAILISWLQNLYFSNGIGIGIGIFEVYHRLSVTFQALFFTDNKKLKSLFSPKNKNLMNDNMKESSLDLKNLITITQLDEHDSLSSLFTQNIYND